MVGYGRRWRVCGVVVVVVVVAVVVDGWYSRCRALIAGAKR